MRISDWSSDVCSSDLAAGLADHRQELAALDPEPQIVDDLDAEQRGGEGEPLDRQQRLVGIRYIHATAVRGSRGTRSPSPSRLMADRRRARHRPGATASPTAGYMWGRRAAHMLTRPEARHGGGRG